MAAVMDISRVDGSRLLALYVIARHADDTGSTFLSMRKIAERCKIAERNARNAIRACEDAGELFVDDQGSKFGVNRYTLSCRLIDYAAELAAGCQHPDASVRPPDASIRTIRTPASGRSGRQRPPDERQDERQDDTPPPPSPSPGEYEGKMTDGGDGDARPIHEVDRTHLKATAGQVNAAKVRKAINREDVVGLVEAFGGDVDTPALSRQWMRDLAGKQLGQIAAVLELHRREDPIRMPSGFRRAWEEWQALDLEERRRASASALASLGIQVQTPPANQSTESAA
jgi:hypothetical protein